MSDKLRKIFVLGCLTVIYVLVAVTVAMLLTEWIPFHVVRDVIYISLLLIAGFFMDVVVTMIAAKVDK